MLELSIRRLLSLYPRGVSNSQLLWRLKDGGLRVPPEDLAQVLVALSDRGEISRDNGGRWRFKASAATPPKPQQRTLKGDLLNDLSSLHALPLSIISLPDPLQEYDTDAPHSGQLPDHGPLMRYYAATQRRDPRGRITLFPDQHAQAWHIVTTQGAWWQRGKLTTPSDRLPESFREALSKRTASGSAALGWPLLTVRAPEGDSVIPALVVPVDWHLSAEALVIETVGDRPSINPDWIRAVRRRTSWTETTLTERLFPDSEPDDLGAVSDRLRHALATLGSGALRPADLEARLTIHPEGLCNVMAFALPTDATFTRATAADLESMSEWTSDLIKQTALASLWADKPSAQDNENPAPTVSLSPLTDCQQAAADSALNSALTVIQGPPGTGKSQVILSLILSSVLEGRSVLFASKNHQALDEVEKRLQEAVPDAPILTRGRDGEGDRDTSFLKALEELSHQASRDTAHEPKGIESLRAILREAARSRAQDRIAQADHLALSEKIDRLEMLRDAWHDGADFERRLRPQPSWRRIVAAFAKWMSRTTPAISEVETPESITRQVADLKKALPSVASSSHSEQAGPTSEAVVALLRTLAGHVTSLSLEDRALISDRVAELNFAQVKKPSKMALHDAELITRYRPVWAISTLSVPSRVPLIPGLFDTVIFDEASQCDIASALPLLARARRAVVVGDPQQLRFVPGLGNATEHALMNAAGLSKIGRSAIAQSTNSLFDFAARRPGARRFFLKDQFRSAPAIVDYLGSEFYLGKGLEGRNTEDAYRPPLGYKAGLSWIDVKGVVTRADGGNINLAEVTGITETLCRLANETSFTGSVGVLSAFNAQVGRLQRAAEDALTPEQRARLGLKIATIDKFQGGEADVVLFSLVAARGKQGTALGFLQKEARRLNVAISRARALCLIVGDLDFARDCGVKHIERLAHRATSPFSPPRPPFDSLWERRLDTAMRGRGLTPFPQYPVGTRYLDFALDPDGRKLDIEVDGKRWHTDADGNRKVSDRLRDRELEGRGWKVVRFWVHELSDDMEGCLDRIERELGRR